MTAIIAYSADIRYGQSDSSISRGNEGTVAMNVYPSVFRALIFLVLAFPTAALSKPNVTLIVNTHGGGSVVSIPAGIDCPGTCASQFPKATEVVLTATASEGYGFVAWAGHCVGIENSCAFKLLNQSAVNAEFQALQEPPKPYPTPVPQTGQVLCYDSLGAESPCGGTGQDGDLNRGVTWPIPRFTINHDGTVTDELTGLVWLQRVDCFHTEGSSYISWQAALTAANALADGQCGLSDGSIAGDWHMPNANELRSLIDYQFHDPALPNTDGTGKLSSGDPFICTGCLSGRWVEPNSWFFSSTTCVRWPTAAIGLRPLDGALYCGPGKTTADINLTMLWPVRDP